MTVGHSLMRVVLLMLLLSWPRIVSAASPFELQLTDLSSTWLPENSVVHVPKQRCMQLQVRLQKPWASDARIDALELKLDDGYPGFRRRTGEEGHFLDLRSREPEGLLAGGPHTIQASSGGRMPIRSEWKVLQWDKAYLEAVSVQAKGLPVQVQVNQPPGGVLLVSGQGKARLQVNLSGLEGLRLVVDGKLLARAAGKPGYEFEAEVEVSSDAKEVVLQASDDAGDTTILVLPVLR